MNFISQFLVRFSNSFFRYFSFSPPFKPLFFVSVLNISLLKNFSSSQWYFTDQYDRHQDLEHLIDLAVIWNLPFLLLEAFFLNEPYSLFLVGKLQDLDWFESYHFWTLWHSFQKALILNELLFLSYFDWDSWYCRSQALDLISFSEQKLRIFCFTRFRMKFIFFSQVLAGTYQQTDCAHEAEELFRWQYCGGYHSKCFELGLIYRVTFRRIYINRIFHWNVF